MDLNAVRIFMAVAQAGSLTAAAERLQLPLATVSRKMRALERDLQVDLLHRAVTGATLTEAGMRLLDRVSVGMEALHDAEQVVRGASVLPKGRLRLSLPQTFTPWWQLLAEFQNQYPDIEVVVYATERRVDLLEDGIDVALRVGDIRHEHLVARELLRFQNVLVASPALLQRLGRPAQPQDVQRFPCAVWSSRVDAQPRWCLGGQVVTPRVVLAANDYQMLTQRALSGDVLAELPPFLAAPGIRDGRLVPLLPEHPLPLWPLHLLYPQSRFRSQLVRTYLNFCLQHLGKIRRACELD